MGEANAAMHQLLRNLDDCVSLALSLKSGASDPENEYNKGAKLSRSVAPGDPNPQGIARFPRPPHAARLNPSSRTNEPLPPPPPTPSPSLLGEIDSMSPARCARKPELMNEVAVPKMVAPGKEECPPSTRIVAGAEAEADAGESLGNLDFKEAQASSSQVHHT